MEVYNVRAILDLVIIDKLLFDVVLVRPIIKRLAGWLYFEVQKERHSFRFPAAILSMQSECALPRPVYVITDNDYFTSDSGGPTGGGDNDYGEGDE